MGRFDPTVHPSSPISRQENHKCKKFDWCYWLLIDDEEFDQVTYDHGCLENLRTLFQGGKKEQLQVGSQLEKLAGELLPSNGTCELKNGTRRTSTSLEDLESFSSDDEGKIHGFQNEDVYIHSNSKHAANSEDESISDEEKDNKVMSSFSFKAGASKSLRDHLLDSESKNQDVSCTWSAVLREAEELVCLHENAGSSSTRPANSEAKKFRKGSGGRGKHKFSIRFQSSKEGLSWPPVVTDEANSIQSEASQLHAGLEALEDRNAEHSMAELLEGLQEENVELSEANQVPGDVVALAHRGSEHSMTELLEGLQEQDRPSGGISSMNSAIKERWVQHSVKRSLSLGDRNLDNEDPLENMDCGMSSEDEESNPSHLTILPPNIEGKTMVDWFQEAFPPAAVDDEGGLFPISRRAGTGYFGRLQQVVQKEKDRHMEFSKQSRTGKSLNDESRCIDVQLLSRYLEAKLTVCQCTLRKDSESSQRMDEPQNLVDGGTSTKWKIVFSPRVCDNVELEIGNVIRIYPPWKEVKVAENETIILCTYFSQIS